MRRNTTMTSAAEAEAESDVTPVQQLVITAFLAGKSMTDAAAAGGVDRSTVYR